MERDMRNSKSVTKQQKSVTEQRDTPRARTPSFGGDVTVSRCHGRRDVTAGERDSDMPALKPAHHGHETQRSHAKTPMTALHVAALNTLQDHEAGVTVSPLRLDAACRLLGRPLPNAAATNTAPARVFTTEEA
jgi:hypothetical protein